MGRPATSIRRFVRWSVKAGVRHPGLVALSLLGMLVQVGAGLALPAAYKLIVDHAIAERRMDALYLALGGMAVAAVVFFLADLLQDYSNARIVTRVLGHLQLTLFAHLSLLSTDFYHRTDESEILARFGGDSRELEQALYDAIPRLFRGLLKLTVNAVLLFVIEWRLALFTMIAIPLVLLVPRRVAPRAQAADADRLASRAAVGKAVQQSVSAQLVVRSFRLQELFTQRLERALEAVASASLRARQLTELVGRLAATGVTIVQFAAVGIGAYFVIAGDLSTGLLLSFLALLANVSASAQAVTNQTPALMRGATAQGRIQELQDEQAAVREADEPVRLSPLEERVALERVSFSYDGRAQNLKGVDLEIPAGQYVAIVGPSGSGKSTVLSLLLRLYDPDEGVVTFDGVPLASASDASLRAEVAVVPQDTRLFDVSVRENIRMGRLEASDREVEAAARMAEIHDVIVSLPDGYDTPAGGRGGRLSGGQRQRVAIARAILRDPSLLLLDEATSALDPAAEDEVNRTVRKVAGGRTVVAVTHRLGAVVECDRICVMSDGALVEMGTHAELLANGALYAALWSKQSGFTVGADDDVEVSVERLRRIPFLSSLDEGHLERLTESFAVESFPAGRTVFEQGDEGDKFFLIARGTALAVLSREDGTEELLASLDSGDFFGEIAIVRKSRRTTSIRTRTHLTALTLTRARFLKLMEDVPEVSAQVVRTITEREYRSADRASVPPPSGVAGHDVVDEAADEV